MVDKEFYLNGGMKQFRLVYKGTYKGCQIESDRHKKKYLYRIVPRTDKEGYMLWIREKSKIKKGGKKLAKRLKSSMVFNGKKYIRQLGGYYNTKKETDKTAEQLRKDGFIVVIDKNKNGYFLWVGRKRGSYMRKVPRKGDRRGW